VFLVFEFFWCFFFFLVFFFVFLWGVVWGVFFFVSCFCGVGGCCVFSFVKERLPISLLHLLGIPRHFFEDVSVSGLPPRRLFS